MGTPTRFLLDILATFPAEVIVSAFRQDSLRYLHLLPSLRLVHYYRSIREDYEMIQVTTFRNNLAHSLPAIGLLAHMLACAFYAVSSCAREENGLYNHTCTLGTWTYDCMDTTLPVLFLFSWLKFTVCLKPVPDQRSFMARERHVGEFETGSKWYIRSLYWMLQTASTVGFGDINPTNLTEIILTLMCTFCGTFLLAIILCQLSAGVNSLQKYRLEYLYKLKGDVVSSEQIRASISI